MLASLILGAMAAVCGSAPLAMARPVTSAAVALDSVGATGTVSPLRRLHSSRQSVREQRRAERLERDERVRAARSCIRNGGINCGATATASSSSGKAFASVGIVTVEEDEATTTTAEATPTTNRRNSADDVPKVEPRPPPPPPPPPPAEPEEDDGEWIVCVEGEEQSWGPMSGRKPEGVTVWADGRCQLAEYAGGFDGFWSTDAGDGHEDGFAEAVKGMLRDKGARVGAAAGKNNPANDRVNRFMQELRDTADPLDMEHPRDEGLADGGKRMENINKASRVCTAMITVRQC